MNPGIITQARLGSTRLPRKVLLPVQSKPLLQYHIDRAQWSDLPIVVATTNQERDDELVEYCIQNEIAFFRGSENDVLERFYQTAIEFDFDPIIRVTSDCPLIDGNLINRGLEQYKGSNVDYLSNIIRRTYPRGMDFEIVSFDALSQGHQEAKLAREREHVTPFILENSERFSLENMTFETDASDLRLTVDESSDFKLIDQLITRYGADELSCKEIVKVMYDHPELAIMNQAVEQKKI